MTKQKDKYMIHEDKSKEDFTLMIDQHEQNGFKILWNTYKIIQIQDEHGTSETWYSVVLELDDKKVKDIKDYGTLGK